MNVEEQKQARLRVLVVEDDMLIALVLADMVVELGHTLSAMVQTVDDAIAHIQDQDLDVVLLDVDLRGRVSSEVAHHCTVKGVPVILTTGYNANTVPEELRHCQVLSKPFGNEELSRALERASQRD